MILEFLTAALLIQVPGAPSCTTADRRVEEAIVATQRELQGQALCQYRLYETLSDVDGDGVTDFFVVFTIEGAHGSATNSIQFLGMFASGTGWRPVVTEVGRRGTESRPGNSRCGGRCGAWHPGVRIVRPYVLPEPPWHTQAGSQGWQDEPGGRMTQPSNKEMQLTRPVQAAASQLISRVGHTLGSE